MATTEMFRTLRTKVAVAHAGLSQHGLFQQLENRGNLPLRVHTITFAFRYARNAATATVWVRTKPGAETRACASVGPAGWVKCGECGPVRVGDKKKVVVTLDKPIEVAPGVTRAIYLHTPTHAKILFSKASRTGVEVHGPLALIPGYRTDSDVPFKDTEPKFQRLLCGGIEYSVVKSVVCSRSLHRLTPRQVDAAAAAAAVTTQQVTPAAAGPQGAGRALSLAELPGLPHTSELLFAERASELGVWIAKATKIYAANRKAIDRELNEAGKRRDADVNIADEAHAERVRCSKLRLQADMAKANAKHNDDTQALVGRRALPTKLRAQEQQLARVIAAHDETLEQLRPSSPSASESSSGGGDDRKRKFQSTLRSAADDADPAGRASAAKNGKRPAKTPRPSRPPEHFCSLTMDVMEDPVIALDGMTYERAAIEMWFKDHDTSPLHGSKIQKMLIPCLAVKNLIRDFEA